ncbi:addiction module protein [Crocosphaera sp. XPORK-15E]|uniref:addiction module protein n=1 Tax=Crocosphaera sp. XPORK-15E TaxID=3110247 RepID=UPI002B20087B|nr:addiction module protein [Crocosphaera sp. XPORK-15E]MEA5535168.1 addiction module protein [Crocosphaera sp. XPORK-15E]
MRSLEQITQEALCLPDAQRLLLLEKIRESLGLEVDEINQNLWIIEAQRRRDEINNGTVIAIDGEKALAQVRKLIDL